MARLTKAQRPRCPHETEGPATFVNGAIVQDVPVHCCRTGEELERGRSSHVHDCPCRKMVGPGPAPMGQAEAATAVARFADNLYKSEGVILGHGDLVAAVAEASGYPADTLDPRILEWAGIA